MLQASVLCASKILVLFMLSNEERIGLYDKANVCTTDKIFSQVCKRIPSCHAHHLIGNLRIMLQASIPCVCKILVLFMLSTEERLGLYDRADGCDDRQ